MSLIPMLLLSRLISVRVLSVVMRVSLPAVRPIVLPAALPTVPRVAAFGSRTLVVLLAPIVLRKESPGLPIRDVDFASCERRLVTACFFVTDIDGSLLPIILPIPRPRSVRVDKRLLLTLAGVEDLGELTAGCLAPVGAEELRAPIVLPIRERWLVVGCFFTFEAGGDLRLLEPPIREAPLELAAGWFALLGTDGLVVLIVLPIREVMLGLIRLLVLVVGFLVVIVRELLLLDGVLVLIELPIRDDMLGLILLFELLGGETELLLRVLMLLLLDRFEIDEFDRVVICRPSVLEFGAVVRELIDRLDVLLLGVRFVITLLEVLLLGVRLVIALLDVLLLGALLVMTLLEVLLLGALLVITLLEVLLLGVRLVIALLDVLLLGALLVMTLLEVLLLGALLVTLLLELRLDETLLDRLDDDLLDVALGAGAGLEACRVCLLELRDLLLLDRVLAAITGSQNNKSANRVQKTRKSELSRRDSTTLIFDL